MLEGVLALGKQARLVEELRGLEMGEAAVEACLRHLGNGLQQRQGHLRPITAAVCSRRLSSGGSRSMRAASTACTVAGTCMVGERLCQTIGARRTD